MSRGGDSVRVAISIILCIFGARSAAAASDSPQERSLAYLLREVPRWQTENHCYSCHNNGDAARAVYAAMRAGFPVPAETVADTTRWLTRPERWEHNGGEGEFNDKKLARLQFAFALLSAREARLVDDVASLRAAAELLAREQERDGSWQIDVSRSVGSPVAYGTPLATVIGRRILARADGDSLQGNIDRADRWLERQPIRNVLDASAVLMAAHETRSDAIVEGENECLTFLREAQSPEGGWGPYRNSPPEPFDTAVAMLALTRIQDRTTVRQSLLRGRQYLINTQYRDGSWMETTRPPGAESYAQRVSTTAWSLMALLATRDLRP